MKQTAWLVQRAVLAVVLMVSFYALALGIAGALLWIPYEAYANDVGCRSRSPWCVWLLPAPSSGRCCRASIVSSRRARR